MHLYFPYTLIKCCMLHTLCNRFLPGWEIISIFKYDEILEQESNSIIWAQDISCSKDGYSDPRGSKYQTCFVKGCIETYFGWQLLYSQNLSSKGGRFAAFHGNLVNHPVFNPHHLKTDTTIQPADQTHNFQKVKAFLMVDQGLLFSIQKQTAH